MEKEGLKSHIEKIIEETFKTLEKAYNNREYKESDESKGFKKEVTRLVFPSYYKDGKPTETRISEQELRFTFVEVFNKYCKKKKLNLFYSIETPTKRKYINFSKDQEPQEDKDGRSAEFDLVIFDESGERKCLIEFKANNADEHDHWKDFVKLNNEKEGDKEVLRYFIEIVKSSNKGTYKNIHGKIKGNESIFRCYSLDGKGEITNDICQAPLE